MKLTKILASLSFIGLIAYAMSPMLVWAAQIQSRNVTLGSSAAGALTSHAFSFTVPTTGSIGSIGFTYCTTAYGACTTPAGLITTSATLASQSGATGFTIVNGVNGNPYISRTSSTINSGTNLIYTFDNITNPSAANTEFWVRIFTYASTDTSGGDTDDGDVAFSTGAQVTVSGYMPESLIFCVGTSGTDCTNMTGTAVSLGIFSPLSTNAATSVMSASTNGSFGYAITVIAGAMSSGVNTIPAMGTQGQNSVGCSPSCTSTVGTSQFGMNLVSNTIPGVGGPIGGAGTGSAFGGYGAGNSFRFSGDRVATAATATKSNLYTTSYIVNVSADQAAGLYSSTVTYICTATF